MNLSQYQWAAWCATRAMLCAILLPSPQSMVGLKAADTEGPSASEKPIQAILISEDPYVVEVPTSKAAKAVLDLIDQYQRDKAKPPTLAQLRIWLVSPPEPLTGAFDYVEILRGYNERQTPVISSEELRELYRAQRDSIAELLCQHTIVLEKENNLTAKTVRRHRFVMSGPRIAVRSETGRPSDAQYLVRAFSYDGRQMQTYSQNHRGGAGIITHLTSKQVFFDDANILANAMLLDGASDSEQEHCPVDVKAMGGIVSETTENRQGVECVVVGSIQHQYYLDPKRGFAVIGEEFNPHNFDRSQGRLVLSDYRVAKDNSEFQDCGNGLWLPRRTITEWYDGSKLVQRQVVDISELSVNQQLVDSELDVIPNGVPVLDEIKGIGYLKGQSKQVPHTLAGVVNPLGEDPDAFVKMVGIVSSLVGLCLMILVVMVRKQRTNETASETD